MTPTKYAYFLALVINAIANIDSNASESDSTIVTISTGKVQGHYQQTVNGRNYLAFLGIPFAKPPIGQLRFKAPQKAEAWQGIYKANNTVVCMQNSFDISGEEDCLNLHVYTPHVTGNKAKLYPVIVYHNAGYFIMAPYYPGAADRLLDKNVVLVYPNFRVGAVGHLSMMDDVLPGNYGFLDQVLALQWIKENIHAFGGDPNSVTLLGVSSGGMTAMLITLSPLSKGLITRSIFMSGCLMCDIMICVSARNATEILANTFNCSTEDSTAILNCLLEQPAVELARASRLKNHSFRPYIDKLSGLYTAPFEEMIRDQNLPRIPVMIGVIPKEMLSDHKNFNALFKLTKKDPLLLRQNVPSSTGEKYAKNLTNILRTVYNISDNMTEQELIEIHGGKAHTDVFHTCCDISVREFATNGFPTYAYLLKYIKSPLGHGAELQFLLKTEPLTDEQTKFSDLLITLVTNFAIYGNPTPEHSDDNSLKLPRWELYQPDNPMHYVIDKEIGMEPGKLSNMSDFLEDNLRCDLNMTFTFTRNTTTSN